MEPKLKYEVIRFIARTFPEHSENGLAENVIESISNYIRFKSERKRIKKFSLVTSNIDMILMKEFIEDLYGIKGSIDLKIRKRNYVDARTQLYYLLSLHNKHSGDILHISLARFGDLLGKHHATVIYYWKRYQNLVEVDKKFKHEAELCMNYYRKLEREFNEKIKNNL